MDNKAIQVIRCPSSRCERCEHELDLHRCELINSGNSDSRRLLLVEPERKLIHLAYQGKVSPAEPPWYENSWETVYMDDIDVLSDELRLLIDFYVVDPYVVFFLYDDTTNRVHYHSIPRIRTSLEFSLIDELSQNPLHGVKPRFTRMTLQQKLSHVKIEMMARIEELLPEINTRTRNTISEIISHNSTILGGIFPLILDDEVEEIFLDRPESPVYFDHRRLGRILISWKPSNEELVRFVTFLRAESNLHLDKRNPSLKADIRADDIPLRISVSLPPLAPEGMHIEIRRARSKPYTMLDLVRNGTLSIDAAALLIVAINLRMNITITGGPGVGKTTLLNALDSTTPKKWRKIYIEDAVESRLYDGQHQVRIRVDPVDETMGTFDKSTEIVKSLHRSPDYLILGEIQTADHSHALFQAIAAGLNSIQTCHSNSSSSLVTRWTKNHNIDESNIALLDLIVTMERPRPGESFRRVKEIVEIKRQENHGIVKFAGLNEIYNAQTATIRDSWSKDGVFHHSASGLTDYVLAYESLVKILQRGIDGDCSDVSNLGEILWSKSKRPSTK